jgi:sugar/nucleoside kinase (ribokinase family)
LRDWKGIAEPQLMAPRDMRAFGELCGATLARAHARSGDRVAIAAYLGRGDVFDRALAAFAESYADQNERDHQALVDAVGTGRLSAEAGQRSLGTRTKGTRCQACV